MSQAPPRRGYTAEITALAFVAAGGAAFWHDHVTHEIPHPVAVPAKFAGARCIDATGKRGSRPHMAIGYEFASQSTRARTSQMTCLLAECAPDKVARQVMDTEYKIVIHRSLQECNAALPAVVALKAPTTVWTGDKDPNAEVRARFTPERDTPPYFLLWVPLVVAVVVLLASFIMRMRRP